MTKEPAKEFNFSQPSNGEVCSCGMHHGVGMWGPGKRAAVYRRMVDRLPEYAGEHMRRYLTSFEAMHGPVLYVMEQDGVSSGEFTPKGTPVMAPRCTSYTDGLGNSGKSWVSDL